MTEWKVRITKQAEADIRAIHEYIIKELQEPDAAKAQTKRIMDAILKLKYMPHRHMLYKKSPCRDIGLRYMPVGNYLVFYLPRDNTEIPTVAVLRVIYRKRNIDEQLFQMNAETKV